MRKKKVLFISPLPPPAGGIASWTKKIFTYGLAQDYFPTIVNSRILGKRKIFEKRLFLFDELQRTLKIFIHLIYQVVFDRPQIIHINTVASFLGSLRDLLCLIIARIFFIKTVTHYRGGFSNIYKESKNKFAYKIKIHKIMAWLSHGNIGQDKGTYELLSNWLAYRKINKPIQLPNFIEDTILDTKKYLPAHPEDCIKIVFVGGITASKGIIELFKIAELFDHARFYLFGEIMEDMQKFILDKPKNVEITENLQNAELMAELKKMDIFFFPSHGEGFPNAVLETMALGLPVIATKVGAIPEMIVDNMGGFLINKFDLSAMENKLKILISNAKLRNEMGDFNREKCRKEYKYSVVIKKLTDYYDTILYSN